MKKNLEFQSSLNQMKNTVCIFSGKIKKSTEATCQYYYVYILEKGRNFVYLKL